MIFMRSRKFRRHLTMLALLGVVLFYGSATAAFKNVHKGMKVPEIQGKDLLSGEKVSTEKLTKDGAEAVVVVFWATWSPRSMEMLRDMKHFAQAHQDKPLEILAVNVEGQGISAEDREKIDRSLTDMDLGFPVLLDPKLEHFNSYGVIAVPSAAVLDRDHILRTDPAGYSLMVKDAIDDSISVLLGLKSVEAVVAMEEGYKPKSRSLRNYNMAIQLMNKRLYERALVKADKAAKIDTLFSSPHSLRGRLLLELGEKEKAEAAFARAVGLDSTSVTAMSGWGGALVDLGNLDQAQTVLEQAVALDPSYAPALVNLARCFLGLGNNPAAEEQLLAARELNPRDPEVLQHLGRFYRANGRNAEAIETYRLALEQLGF